ncbi:hypothetical protein BN137_3651 [Cronobacter condimenti 1330]|uniref:Uncharacterized protein n=1 Tax=Cronobacter condimenti 1330 TaxID=1073999 RepID=K8A302_9ENTR|nr:hypothetical protein BN137_3651 [Cronobacter condimenti 1330]
MYRRAWAAHQARQYYHLKYKVYTYQITGLRTGNEHVSRKENRHKKTA